MGRAVDARALRAWLAMGLWAAFVWSLGSDGMASQETSRIIGPILDWLLPDLSWQERRSLMYGIRKGAHVFEYATLALLSLRALWLSWRHSLLLTSVFAAGVVATMAIADESRQSYSAVRTGSGWDVALDISGGLLAIAGFLIFRRLRGPSNGSRDASPQAP